MCFAEGPVEIVEAGWSTELTSHSEDETGMAWFVVGLTVTGYGVMQVRRLRKKSTNLFQPVLANSHDQIFSDHRAMDEILFQPKVSESKENPYFALHQPASDHTNLRPQHSMICSNHSHNQPRTTPHKGETVIHPEKQSRPLSRMMSIFSILLCFSIGGFCLFKSGIGSSIEQPAVAMSAASEQSPQPQFKLKSVADYKVGDTIMAFNHETGQREQKTVTQTFKRQVDHLRILEVESEDGSMQTIKTTNEHPFWSTAANDYVEAKHLKPGTRLEGANGHTITVKSSRYEPHPEGITVYNVEVKGNHNYFVAANGYRGPPVLAHNTCQPKSFEYTQQSRSHGYQHGHAANSAPQAGKSRFRVTEGGKKFADEIMNHPRVKIELQGNGRFLYEVDDVGRFTGWDRQGNRVRGGRVLQEGPNPFWWSTYFPGEIVTMFPI